MKFYLTCTEYIKGENFVTKNYTSYQKIALGASRFLEIGNLDAKRD